MIIDSWWLRSEWPFPASRKAFCIFEYVYFARPDSTIAGVNVSHARVEMGLQMACQHPVEADLVIPVPDSGVYAALRFLGRARDSSLPRLRAPNYYIGRTFIEPTQRIRDLNVRVKLNLILEAVKGKRVVVVDDSIGRGTTARSRVVTLREVGAKQVHMRISCPPHKFA